MKKSGCFKNKSKRTSPTANIVFYVIEFLILLLPIIKIKNSPNSWDVTKTYKSYNGFNMHESMSIFFYIIIGAIIVGIILNIILHDVRKTIVFDILSQLFYLATSIVLISTLAEYKGYTSVSMLSGGFGLILMTLLGLVGSLYCITQNWSISKPVPLETNSDLLKETTSTK